MSYVNLEYYILVAIILTVYYLLPRKVRWTAILAGSAWFYVRAAGDVPQMMVFVFSIVISFAASHLINRQANKNMRIFWLWSAVLLSAGPLIVFKGSELFLKESAGSLHLIVPVGLSFYTMQMIAYLADVYYGKISPQNNLLKYALFISFFPQIIQGPIPRYEQLGVQLFKGSKFEFTNLVRGAQLLLWGFFLKMMIADKAAIAVNQIFDHYRMYAGVYVLVAGVLYSIQLYTDFLACTVMAKGAAELFGISVADNFSHPYFSVSIQEFWRRWHMSLSSWLKDYIYIPLGGNRKGKFSKYVNLIITFGVSGVWHGGSWKFVFWGLLHAGYQIAGGLTRTTRDRLYKMAGIEKDSFAWKLYRTVGTFVWVMFAWIIFRAESLKTGLLMIKSVFTTFNPWILLNGSLNDLMDYREWEILGISVFILFFVSRMQERMVIRDWILKQHISVRWGIYVCTVLFIWLCGTYGFGFDAQNFIYGGF